MTQQFTISQLPAEYRPDQVEVFFNGVEAYRIEDGELDLSPDWSGEFSAEPSLIEIFWDGQIVYCQKSGVITLNRLEQVVKGVPVGAYLKSEYKLDTDKFLAAGGGDDEP